MFTRQLSRADERMIFLQCPRGEIFIHGENESSVRRLVIKKFFEFDAVFELFGDQRLDLRPHLLLRFAERHAPINEDDRLIRHRVDGRRFDVHVADGDLAMPEKFMVAELRFEIADARVRGDWWVDENGMGFVLRLPLLIWRRLAR